LEDIQRIIKENRSPNSSPHSSPKYSPTYSPSSSISIASNLSPLSFPTTKIENLSSVQTPFAETKPSESKIKDGRNINIFTAVNKSDLLTNSSNSSLSPYSSASSSLSSSSVTPQFPLVLPSVSAIQHHPQNKSFYLPYEKNNNYFSTNKSVVPLPLESQNVYLTSEFANNSHSLKMNELDNVLSNSSFFPSDSISPPLIEFPLYPVNYISSASSSSTNNFPSNIKSSQQFISPFSSVNSQHSSPYFLHSSPPQELHSSPLIPENSLSTSLSFLQSITPLFPPSFSFPQISGFSAATDQCVELMFIFCYF
jgi:hypothetical protein